jgi:hypothetical protein
MRIIHVNFFFGSQILTFGKQVYHNPRLSTCSSETSANTFIACANCSIVPHEIPVHFFIIIQFIKNGIRINLTNCMEFIILSKKVGHIVLQLLILSIQWLSNHVKALDQQHHCFLWNSVYCCDWLHTCLVYSSNDGDDDDDMHKTSL